MENGKQKAFPFLNSGGYGDLGLTKREYFAGLAMQGIFASNVEGLALGRIDIKGLVEMSVIASDELLKQLDKPE
jgi:hypothetical protein